MFIFNMFLDIFFMSSTFFHLFIDAPLMIYSTLVDLGCFKCALEIKMKG